MQQLLDVIIVQQFECYEIYYILPLANQFLAQFVSFITL